MLESFVCTFKHKVSALSQTSDLYECTLKLGEPDVVAFLSTADYKSTHWTFLERSYEILV